MDGLFWNTVFLLKAECSDIDCWTNCLEILTGLEDSVLGQGSWEIQLIQIWTIPPAPGSTFTFLIVVFIKGDRTGKIKLSNISTQNVYNPAALIEKYAIGECQRLWKTWTFESISSGPGFLIRQTKAQGTKSTSFEEWLS